MLLPDFDDNGDLPDGVHPADLATIVNKFNGLTQQRKAATEILLRIHAAALATKHLDRFVIFGSYVTSKQSPRDVDIVLIMDDDFKVEECTPESVILFDHEQAERNFGASIFWIRPALLLEDVDSFVRFWGTKRGGARRGIVEVMK